MYNNITLTKFKSNQLNKATTRKLHLKRKKYITTIPIEP
jgi:hypothetical protein